MKQYDFSALNKFLNTTVAPNEICNDLIALVFNYARCLDAVYIDKFKDDIATIEQILSEFRILADQE